MIFVKVFPESIMAADVIAAAVITTLLICDPVEPYVIFRYAFGCLDPPPVKVPLPICRLTACSHLPFRQGLYACYLQRTRASGMKYGQ